MIFLEERIIIEAVIKETKVATEAVSEVDMLEVGAIITNIL